MTKDDKNLNFTICPIDTTTNNDKVSADLFKMTSSGSFSLGESGSLEGVFFRFGDET
jgi:hypothetical protein